MTTSWRSSAGLCCSALRLRPGASAWRCALAINPRLLSHCQPLQAVSDLRLFELIVHVPGLLFDFAILVAVAVVGAFAARKREPCDVARSSLDSQFFK